ncbi:MAG: Fic family protein [Alphaproteobacteria bacterium]
MTQLLSDSDRAVAELNGASRTLPNPDLFVAMYVRKEAVLSSQIEGTQSTLDDVLKAEAKISAHPGDVGEVLNYVGALNMGLERLNTRPLTGTLIREIHERLMSGVRGGDKRPGRYRSTQVHIGPEGAAITEAIYVPPPPTFIQQSMDSLERYLNSPTDLPPLLKVGLAHAQFETIHPFADGNGRAGRLLIAFLLCRDRVLDRPVLFLSHYLKGNRDAYYEALQRTRTHGDFEAWLKFFLRATTNVARQASQVAARISQLREDHRTRIAESYPRGTKNAFLLLDRLFQLPIITRNGALEWLKLTHAGATNIIRKFEEIGILTEVTGYARHQVYEYTPYRRLFNDS